ncbi:MAG: hypothetical protein ACRDE2_05250 [Chitinophagaceae bacterium]
MAAKHNSLQKILLCFPTKTRKYPRLVISEFFWAYDLSEHRWYIDTWMDSVNHNDYWKGNVPSDLLLYYESLKELINASYILIKEEKKRKTALDILDEKGLDAEKNLLHPALYFGQQPYGTIWDFFPRSLNKKEYIDPYLAVRQFFKFEPLEKWHDRLHDLLIDGLTGYENREYPIEGIDLSFIRKNLHKLIEATHLIDVRETDKIAGKFPKEKLYTLDNPYP